MGCESKKVRSGRASSLAFAAPTRLLVVSGGPVAGDAKERALTATTNESVARRLFYDFINDNDGELPTEDDFKSLAATTNEFDANVAVAESAARLWRKLVSQCAAREQSREDALRQADLPDYAPVDLSALRTMFVVNGVAVPTGRLKRSQVLAKIRQLEGQNRVTRSVAQLRAYLDWRDEEGNWPDE